MSGFSWTSAYITDAFPNSNIICPFRRAQLSTHQRLRPRECQQAIQRSPPPPMERPLRTSPETSGHQSLICACKPDRFCHFFSHTSWTLTSLFRVGLKYQTRLSKSIENSRLGPDVRLLQTATSISFLFQAATYPYHRSEWRSGLPSITKSTCFQSLNLRTQHTSPSCKSS